MPNTIVNSVFSEPFNQAQQIGATVFSTAAIVVATACSPTFAVPAIVALPQRSLVKALAWACSTAGSTHFVCAA